MMMQAHQQIEKMNVKGRKYLISCGAMQMKRIYNSLTCLPIPAYFNQFGTIFIQIIYIILTYLCIQ